MNDETRVIARHGLYRVLEDGTLENKRSGRWVLAEFPGEFPALLADAVRRIEEDFEERIEEIVVAAYGRVEALERRITELDGWHPGYPDEKPLALRVAALEQAMKSLPDYLIQGAENFDNRLKALESRQQDEAGDPKNKCWIN